uniref:Immunoglobulin V-set domain-containing protein n=1 Tax=Oncorhynchus kisutch TaxID=8019 RepID=A0A8C7CUH8_ONCKI
RMARTFLPALLLYGLISDYGGPYWGTITLQCSNVTTVVGHTVWFKQVNGSEPVCLIYEHSEMFSDCGLYVCALYPHRHMFFDNANIQGHCNGTISLVGEDDDGTMYLLPLVVILGVVTAVLLIVILFLKSANLQNQDPDALNYAALNFTSKKRKLEKRREKELDPHVVYAATR